MADETERTEPATPKKREDAREKGQVAKSTDVATVFMLLAGALSLLSPLGESLVAAVGRGTLDAWSGRILPPDSMADYHAVLLEQGGRMALALAPFALILAVAAIVGNVVQVVFRITPKAFEPNLGRFNPLKGLRRLVNVDKLFELAKAMVKLTVTTLILIQVMRPALSRVFTLMDAHPMVSAVVTGELASRAIWLIILSLAFFAVLDYVWQHHRFEKQLRMTKQEVRDEVKQREGDPHVKARIKQLQREVAMSRMIADVAKADVVVTNPTHYAVALEYRPAELGTPKVLAKGRNHLARRIREAAREHDVPIVENPPLAQLLYKTVEVDREIPENLYQAVAEVLAYVYRLDPDRAARWRAGS